MRLLRSILVLFAISLCSWEGWGQTYSASPTTSTCASQASYQAGSTTYYRGFTKMSATFSGNTATITLSLCSGSGTLPANTSIKLRESTSNNLTTVLQGSTVKTVTSGSSSSSFAFTYTLPFSSGTRYYSVVATIGGLETCTEVMGITASSGSSGGNPPSCSVTGVTNITAHSATLSGQVNPNGSNTSYLFQYATNSSFPTNSTGNTTATIAGSGNGNVTVSAQVSNLAENSRYYYRIMALNSNGTTTSSYSTFDTPYDIQLNASMGIPTSMTVGQSYNISIRVLNNSLEQFRGCFYLKDGNTNVLDWSNVTISSSGVYTLEKSYTPASSGTKSLTLYHQSNCSGNGIQVDGRYYSNPITVTINQAQPQNPPSATTGNAYKSTNTATLYGTFNPNGTRTMAKFQYGTNSASLTNEKDYAVGAYFDGNTERDANVEITGLTPNTLYYYRIVAVNQNGLTTYGTTRNFTTDNPAVAPTATLNNASNITGTEVTLSGTVNPQGQNTYYVFEYARNSNFTSSSMVPASPENIGSGTGNVSVSKTVSGLLPNTPYYYRLYASSTAGTTTTPYKEFTTDVGDILKLENAINIEKNMIQGQSYPYSFTIRNNSSNPWTGTLVFKIVNDNGQFNHPITIQGISTATINGSYNATYAGYFSFAVYYRNSSNQLVLVDPGNYSNPVNVSISFAPAYYNVTFNANGGSPTPPSQKVVSGGYVAEPQTPSRSGFSFNGWYEGTHLWNFSIDTIKYYDVTLTAQWTQLPPPNQPSTIGTNPVNPVNGATNVDYASVTLQWTASDPDNNIGGFDLYYRTENGSWNSEALHAVNGLVDRRTLTNLQPATKYFWKVMVWDTDNAPSNWSSDWSFTTKAAPPTTYTVSFDPDGGTCSSCGQQTVTSGSTVARPSPDPTKSGYQFDGWYNGSTLWIFSTPVTGPLSLKAKWTQIVVTPDIRMMSSIRDIPSTVTVGETVSFKAMVQNHNTNDWEVAFYLKDGIDDIWPLGYYQKINQGSTYSVEGTFTVPNRTGSRTWILYYLIKGQTSGAVVKNDLGSNQIVVTVNSATPVNQPPSIPNSPTPGNGTTNVPINQILRWVSSDPEDGTDLTYQLSYKKSDEPQFKTVSGSGLSTEGQNLTFEYGKTYQWYVVVSDKKGLFTRGPANNGTWSFTTAYAPATSVDLTLSQPMVFRTSSYATITTLTQGETYTFTARVQNTGTSDWKGFFYLKTSTDYGENELEWENKSVPEYSIPIGEERTLMKSYTPGVDDIGANKQYTLWYVTDGGSNGIVKGGSNSNPIPITVTAPVSVSLEVKPKTTSVDPHVFGPEIGGTTTFTVTSNVTWSIDNQRDWVEATKSSNTTLTLKILKANETGNERGGTITVTAGNKQETIYIKQLAKTTPQTPNYEIVLYSKNRNVPVIGVAADGEAYVEIRVKKLNNNAPDASNIDYRLLNTIGQTGKLFFEHTENPGLNNNSYYSNLFTAPAFFDETGLYKIQQVEAKISYKNGITETISQNITIIRPPVMLVHGINADPSTFEKLEQKLLNVNLYRDWQVLNVDYKGSNKASFEFNEYVVKKNLKDLIAKVNAKNYEVKKVDVVAHSMGGLLTRQYLQSNDYNYDINRIITLNTPHSGSQAANLLLTGDMVPENVRSWMFDGEATKDLCVDSKAIAKLNGEMLNRNTVPSHVIVTDFSKYENSQGILSGTEYLLLTIYIFYKDEGNDIFMNEYNDLIVAESSQGGGINNINSWNSISNFQGIWHSESPKNENVIQKVVELLIAHDNSGFTMNGFHPSILKTLHPSVGSTFTTRSSVQSEIHIMNIDKTVCKNDETVTVKIKGSSDINKMSLLIQGDNNMFYMELKEGNENEFAYTVPSSNIGERNVFAIGYNTKDKIIVLDSAKINIVTDAALVSIETYTDGLILPIGVEYNISLKGLYDDGVYRNIGYLEGMTFSSSEGNIIFKFPDLMIGKSVGLDTLFVSYHGITTSMPVEVIEVETTPTNNENNSVISSIKEIVTVYPNPTTGIVKIECDEVVQAIELFDLTGKTVLNLQFNRMNPEFSIEKYPRGFYFLRVITKERNEVKKIIKL